MKMSMTGQMRMEQRMILAPRMIQSMEILQLPLLALQERIERELNDNPVLEQYETETNEEVRPEAEQTQDNIEEKEMVVKDDGNMVEDFQRLDSLDYENDEYMPRSKYRGQSGDRDRKQEALQNTAAPESSLYEHLVEQWRLTEAEEPVKKAGQRIIDYIDDKGYLTVRLAQLYNKDKKEFTLEDLEKALLLVQKLEPAGVGAGDLRECLLIQMAQKAEDMSFEQRLVTDYMEQLLENHLPEIAKKMDCSLERINEAIARISKLDTSPGLQVGRTQNHFVTADVIVEPSDDPGKYTVRLADTWLPGLRISRYYSEMAKDKKSDEKTKTFLKQNIQSAHWLIDAIEQRRNTLLKVAQSVVKRQIDFFEKGQLHLKPLPMSKVAQDVGVHLATVSRAVAGKYIQCPGGILPLRGFFSGGTEAADGKSRSWKAIRAKLQQIVNEEDKAKPLSDDEIRKKLTEAGVTNIARRTVAKYRKLLKIPSARFRKRY